MKRNMDRKYNNSMRYNNNIIDNNDHNNDFIRYEYEEFKKVSKHKIDNNIDNNNYIDVLIGSNKFNNMHLTNDIIDEHTTYNMKEADALHDKGYLYRKKGEYEKAIGYYTQALVKCPMHHRV